MSSLRAEDDFCYVSVILVLDQLNVAEPGVLKCLPGRDRGRLLDRGAGEKLLD